MILLEERPRSVFSREKGAVVTKDIKGFSRLKEALQASESESNTGTEAYLVRKIKEKAEKFDLRAIVMLLLFSTNPKDIFNTVPNRV